MGSYINKRIDYATGVTGAQTAIPLNRWSLDDYSVIVDLATTGTYTVEGTVDFINRPLDADFQATPTPVWFNIVGMVGLTADASQVVPATPLEAIRINIAANATGIKFHVMQAGS